MKGTVCVCFLVALSVSSGVAYARGVNGGMSCAVCTVLVGVAAQVAELHEESFLNGTLRLCALLPSFAKKTCSDTVSKLEPYFGNSSEVLTPDALCLTFGTCTAGADTEICHLFPLPSVSNSRPNLQLKPEVGFPSNLKNARLPKIDVCTLPVVEDICNILNNSFISLDAAEDFDGDGFSFMSTARGSDWRGKDCDDSNADFHPGRKPLVSDFNWDSNCNGIWGVDPKTQKTWEQKLCKKFRPRGLIWIGDSIGAHFHLPEVWMDPEIFELPGLNGTDVILDEIDWPQFGFATGYRNITQNILIQGTVDSIYLRLRSRNRCNHRDYQNLSQNGASSYEGVSHAKSVARNQSTDNPALVIYAMQGNDVCNNCNDTVTFMTTPKQFRKNVMKVLSLLDERLPSGSHVVLVALVNADFIYSAMADLLHPLGKWRGNIYYKDVYEWFNCMQIGPCFGWLNSNETLRNITTQKAQELSRVLRNIVKYDKFEHFQLHFVENPINVVMNQRKISVPDFLESVDSLHPNQAAQPILAEALWDLLEKLPSEVLGPVNPHNEVIENLFGDQGGH